MEFVNILLQMEAKPVKMRLHFFNSAVIANSKWSIHYKRIKDLYVFKYDAYMPHDYMKTPEKLKNPNGITVNTLHSRHGKGP